MRIAVVLSALFLVAGQGVAFAKTLTCPTIAPATVAIAANDIKSLAAVGNPVDRAAILGRVVATLRDRGMIASGIVDSLISAYCPLVAANSSLSDPQKVSDMRRFAAEAVRAAYAFDSAESIIIDISVPPSVATAIGERAAQDRVTPQEWAATAVINAVKAPK